MLSPIGTLPGVAPLAFVLAVLVSLGVPSAEGMVPRNFRATLEDARPNDVFADPEAEPSLDLGYSFVPEGYPVSIYLFVYLFIHLFICLVIIVIVYLQMFLFFQI